MQLANCCWLGVAEEPHLTPRLPAPPRTDPAVISDYVPRAIQVQLLHRRRLDCMWLQVAVLHPVSLTCLCNSSRRLQVAGSAATSLPSSTCHEPPSRCCCPQVPVRGGVLALSALTAIGLTKLALSGAYC